MKENIISYSIIIPVYNNKLTDVQRCLDSIYCKILTNFEVLLMDDGSGIECANALDKLIKRYSCVRVFHLPHGGAAQARNQGILCAKGEYICFCDADDYVTKQFLMDLENYKKSKVKYDVVYGLVTAVREKSMRIENSHTLSLHEITCKEYRELYRHMFDLGSKFFRKEIGYVNRGPVARIVRRKVAEKTLFNPALVLGEDELWNLDLLEATNKLAVVYHSWYFYVYNPMSTSRKPNPKFVKQHRDLLVSMLPYMKKHEGSLEGAFANRVFESLHEIIKGYYFTPLKKGSFFKNMKEFNKMVKGYPYTIITYKYTKKRKTRIKFALMKLGWLFAAYKLKYMMLKR